MFWQKVTPGAASIMKITDPELGLKQIIITVRNERKSVTMTVTKLAGKPASVTKEINGTVFKYMEIKLDNINASDLETSSLSFSVPKSWLESYHLLKENVKLYRYSNGWQELPTEIKEETDAEITYEATTPGFSYFAIAGIESLLVQETVDTPAETPEDTTGLPETNPDEEFESIPDNDEVEPKTEKVNYFMLVFVLTAICSAVIIIYIKMKQKQASKRLELHKKH